jgi:uncharacterized protein
MRERGVRTIAVVGSGVSGLTAAYILQRKFEVTLFEADDRLGGHAHTHEPAAGLMIDSGFIVHNARTYPHLTRLFDELGVRTQDAEMSLGVRCDGCGLQYAGGRRLGGLFAQPAGAVRGPYLRMLSEIPRFYRLANRLLDEPGTEPTLGDFLDAGRYSRYFTEHFALPLVSTVWSVGDGLAAQYPARHLFRFLRNHGMLAIGGSPRWRTVVGGSRNYVERIVGGLGAVHVSTPVRAVVRDADGVRLRDDADTTHLFDHAVIATHPRQALAVLASPTAAERASLGAFRYTDNEAWLHNDGSLLPTAPRARSSWNHLKTACAASGGPALVSYDLNRLMRLGQPLPYVVTLNPGHRVRPDTVIARMNYEHPIYDSAAVAAQRDLPGLNDGRLAFAGAYHGWGFHEDGCSAGVRAAESLGAHW